MRHGLLDTIGWLVRQFNAWRASFFLVLVVFSACDFRPGPPVTRVVEPPDWQEEGAVAAAWPAPEWWRAFQSPELDELIRTALADNFDLDAAAARVAQADAQLRIAAAPSFPSLDVSGNTRRQGLSSNATTTPGSGVRIQDLVQTTFSASYEIDFWSRNRNAYAAAEFTRASVRFDWQTMRTTILANVANGYFQILALRSRIMLAERLVMDAEEVLRGILYRVQIGTATELEVAQQRNFVETQRATIPALGSQLSQQTNALSTLLARPPGAIGIAAQSLSGLHLPAVAAGLPSELLRRRPDVASTQAQVEAANRQLGATIATRYPQIVLTAQGGLQSLALNTFLSPASGLWSLSAALTEPLFAGGRIEAAVDRDQARLRELVALYQRVVLAAFADVDAALTAVRRAREQEGITAAAAAAARVAAAAALARFRNGTVDTINVLDAQRSFFQAQDSLIQARLLTLITTVSLWRAMGGGWEGTDVAGDDADRDAAIGTDLLPVSLY